jgi:hypothetical protein
MPQKQIWVPGVSPPRSASGPTVVVYLKYSELFPGSHPAEEYWKILQQVPVVNAVGIFAAINNALARSPHEIASYRQLDQAYLASDIAAAIDEKSLAGNAFPVAFNRLSNLAVIRNLVLYGTNTSSSTDLPQTVLGTLALCANDFIEHELRGEKIPTPAEFAAHHSATWDLYNGRDLAYALTRMHVILTELLPGEDPEVVLLRERIGLESLAIDSMELSDFVAVVFGLYAFGNAGGAGEIERSVFDSLAFLSGFPDAARHFRTFLNGRALTLEGLAQKLGGARPRTNEQFLEDNEKREVLKSGISVFRQHPLLLMEDGRVIILDHGALVELLTSGLYWLIFDSLDKKGRGDFRQLWGRVFELYAGQLLREFYPLSSSLLSIDGDYAGGQIDALLDFGSDIFVFEIKSSLLTETAKRSGDIVAFTNDVGRKFVRNEDDRQKGVAQLALAAKAIKRGAIATAHPTPRIYPVLLVDEPACECPFFNKYLNEHFQRELGGTLGVRPVTVMSINELEEFLPYAAGNAISWETLCEARFFNNNEVGPESVHQTLYTLREVRGIALQRNEHILRRFTAIYENIRRVYSKSE